MIFLLFTFDRIRFYSDVCWSGKGVNYVIQLKLKRGESVERALKRLKKIMDKEGLLKQLRNNRYYEKPCEKARRKSARARARNNSRRGMREMF
jgi:small subunit ribosomal protein S21